MGYYDLSVDDRKTVFSKMVTDIEEAFKNRSIAILKEWENKDLVIKALNEILDTHKSYEKFSAKSYSEAEKYIKDNFPDFI